MKKLSFADKLAKKSFENAQFQKSWAVHMQAFGPILEPAFAEDYQAKIHLTAALNHLSTKNTAQALPKLQILEKHIETDEDRTAWLFFMGLYHEISGDADQMLSYYTWANLYGHSFYLPYMKAAKFFLSKRAFDRAAENYRAAIDCLNAAAPGPQTALLQGSAYANLASCMIGLQCYDEAETALENSRKFCPNLPGRDGVEAILQSARGETKAPACKGANERAVGGMEQIWNLPDPVDFVNAMMEHLEEKTGNGENLSALSKEERVFYIAQTLEMEVNGGGFSQFFYNSGGAFSGELADAFSAIGAETTAAICKKAVAAFGREIPSGLDARRKLLEELENDEINRILEACDDAFFTYEDDLEKLNYRFALKNRECFG